MNRRLAAILGLGVVPWSIVLAGNELTLVFAFGLVDPQPFFFTNLYTYVTAYTRGLPQFLRAWPIGTGIYALAVLSALSGAFLDREDRRVTALLLVLVGLTQLSFAWGFTRRTYTVAFPVGTVLAWTIVWWFDWETLRALVPASR